MPLVFGFSKAHATFIVPFIYTYDTGARRMAACKRMVSFLPLSLSFPFLWNKFCSVCCSDDAVKGFEISPKGICVAFLLPEKP